MIYELVSNNIFLSVISSLALVQLLKVFTYSIKFGKMYWRGFFESGGLPSSHSAIVTCLTVSIYLIQGLSLLFYSVLFFSLIIMYDAMGVRRETGRQGAIINELIKKNKLKVNKPMKEFVGHSPLEVLLGACVGFLMALIFI
jgi:hypothetical protein